MKLRAPKVPSGLPCRGGATTRDRTLRRDYFRVQTADGARLWLYREGHYGEDTPPRWFVHGLLS
jgi:hypothetical protein